MGNADRLVRGTTQFSECSAGKVTHNAFDCGGSDRDKVSKQKRTRATMTNTTSTTTIIVTTTTDL